MKITFWGAAGDVTGSMHQVSAAGKDFLLDCGMYQGRRKEAERLNRTFPFPPQSIEAVILSHAHIDHSGNLPLLVKNGFHNPIYATPATVDLCQAMLRDTAHIQEQDARFLNKHRRNGEEIQPLYTQDDAEATMHLFHQTPYYAEAKASDALSYRFQDAGHILGSATTMLEAEGVKLAFSGDVGRPGLPIIRDPDPLTGADYLILESTYGDRNHEAEGEVVEDLEIVVKRTIDRGGRLIVPAFAVGRVQQLVILLHQLFNEGRLPEVPIFVDSPLAVDVTEVFKRHPECYDDEARKYLNENGGPFGFKRLQYIRDVEDSKKLNEMKGPFIVISPSGMCEAGRVLHHLKNNIEDPRNTVLITGYQAVNTLGRKLLDRVPEVNILNERRKLRCEVASLQALSGHAGHDELIAWMKPLVPSLKKVFLVHGEPGPASALAEAIRSTYGLEAIPAARGQSFLL